MRISFVCPSAPTPLGGVTALYEFANGLCRRGHEVHIAHGAFWGRPGIRDLSEVGWFRFEPGITHHIGDGPIPLPEADIIFGTDAPPEMGLPVLLVQGAEMFPEALERAVFRTPCLKVCVASWLVAAGARHGTPSEQLVHVPMGIDHDLFRVTTPLDERPLQVGMLYNDHPAKGWVPGLDALERVHALVPGTTALVFGTKAPPEALPEWVTLVVDPAPEVLVAEVYNRCRVFLQPSFWEGFGFTAVEAMACGCALVSTDNGGSLDYALDGDTALVAAEPDAAAMAELVASLLVDDPDRRRLAEQGIAHVQRFRWDRGAELLEGHLQRYLADPDAFRQPPAPLPGRASEPASATDR